jgi:DNA-binding XRE family transcriptional regulator
MTPKEFRSWREKLGLSQQGAADALGISIGSIGLYERGSRREDNRAVEIPKTVEFACERATRLWKQCQPEFGPVSLIYTDGPMTQPVNGRSRPPMMRVEQFPSNQEAITRVCALMKSQNCYHPFISDQEGTVWNAAELRMECGRREKRSDRRVPNKVVSCPNCGLHAWIVGPTDNSTVNINAVEMNRLCRLIDEQTEQGHCPVMQETIDAARGA